MSYAAPPYELRRHPMSNVPVVVVLMFVSPLKWHEQHRGQFWGQKNQKPLERMEGGGIGCTCLIYSTVALVFLCNLFKLFSEAFFWFLSFWLPLPCPIFEFCRVLYVWLFLARGWRGGDRVYLIKTTIGCQIWEEGVGWGILSVWQSTHHTASVSVRLSDYECIIWYLCATSPPLWATSPPFWATLPPLWATFPP